MKLTPHPHHNGFTLIELLVVIAIIAILSSILIPAASRAKTSILKKRALMECQSIRMAILQFKQEHLYMPWPPDSPNVYVGPDQITTDQSQPNLIQMLCGSNILKKVYIEIPEAARAKDNPNLFLDPWNHPYLIAIDRDMNGVIENTDALGSHNIHAEVAVCSFGPRKSSYDPKEAIQTW